MIIKNIILKRLPIILITSLGIGLLILVPIVLTTETTFNRYFFVFSNFFLLSIIGWITNIVFSIFFIQSLKSYLWKWLASTICLILCMYLSNLIFKNLFIIKTPNFGYFRMLAVICFNIELWN